MKDIKIHLLIVLLVLGFNVVAQVEENLSSNALKRLGMSAERGNDPYQAIDLYERYLEKAKTDAMISYRLAECYRKARDYEKALEQYEIAYAAKADKFPKALYYQAKMQQTMGNCEKAILLFDEFRKVYRGGSDAYEYRRLAKNAVEGCELTLADTLQTKAIISHLDNSINKAHIESSPIIYGDSLLFTSLPMDNLQMYKIDSDTFPKRAFFAAVEKDKSWKNMGAWNSVEFPENTNISSGAFSLDGNRFYFSACKTDENGKNKCQIWKSVKQNNSWGKAVKLAENVNHPNFTSTQPAVGTDYKGREVLYFVSDRNDGKGKMDIWYSRFNDRNNEFTAARNCGSKVNSVGNELSPFINPQNRNLYFSSDGHPGMGGLDIFKTVGERSKWIEPKNIGKPINSSYDELYFTLSEEGESGFFASNRKESVALKNKHCCDDLYEFVFPDFVKVQIKGLVIDDGLGKTLEQASVRLYMIADEFPLDEEEQADEEEVDEIFLKEIQTDNEGKFDLPVEAGYDYVIRIKKKDFLQQEVYFSTKKQMVSGDIERKIFLKKMPYTSLIIENIYYEFDKAELTESAKITIDTTILPIMQNNPEIIAEISSHTDSKGSEGYNKHLSQKRAESVVKYLRRKGIDKDRLQAKGYGEEKPIAKNKNEDGSDNEAGRAKNRRTEFKVIGILDVDELEYLE